MALTLHTIAPNKGAKTKKFRVGRGEGSGSGKTAGRGTKGQRSRSGGRNKLKMRGMRQMLLSFPKLRGFKSRHIKATTLRLDKVTAAFASNEKIDLKALKSKGLIEKTINHVKLVGAAAPDKILVFADIAASASAKAAVEKAGGSFAAAAKKKKK
jgi:large subunit ribosomal protein L15